MQLRHRPLKSLDRFLDPRLFGAGNQGGCVGDDGMVRVRESRFAFISPEDALPPGTNVTLRITREGFFGITDEDQQQFDDWCRAEYDRSNAEYAERVRRYREESASFNAALAIPYKWRPAHRIVLSGLLEHSNGDGRRRNTVIHVMFDEDVKIGRLKRKAGQFLCSTHTDAFGSEPDYRASEGHPVTCKQCLAMAQRFSAQTLAG